MEICSNCHPLYTGKSKLVDVAGRVERFHSRAAKQDMAAKTRLGKKAKVVKRRQLRAQKTERKSESALKKTQTQAHTE